MGGSRKEEASAGTTTSIPGFRLYILVRFRPLAGGGSECRHHPKQTPCCAHPGGTVVCRLSRTVWDSVCIPYFGSSWSCSCDTDSITTAHHLINYGELYGLNSWCVICSLVLSLLLSRSPLLPLSLSLYLSPECFLPATVSPCEHSTPTHPGTWVPWSQRRWLDAKKRR